MSLVLALDQGTSSSRAIVFGPDASIAALAQRAVALSYPHPGWVETDPLVLWDDMLAAARQAVRQAGLARIGAIGIANQRETTLLWERAGGRPLYPAIGWQDRRTMGACEALLADGHAGPVQQMTGLLPDPYFSATKLAWLLDHVPDARARAERAELCFGTVDSWLVYQLTGGREHLTDPSNAARTMLYNLHTRRWDPALLALFDIPAALLPRVVPSSGVCALADPRWFGAALPIAGIGGDQQAATFGQDCVAPGLAKATYGTGCFILANSGASASAPGAGLLTTLSCEVGGRADYLVEGAVFMGGAIVQWLAETGIVADAREAAMLAASVPDSGGVTLVPAFAGLGAPYWDAGARATLTGMSRATGKAQIARAALDAIALQCADVVEAMNQAAGVPVSQLRVDGGASVNDHLMQLQADLLGLPVLRGPVTETTAWGAARLAGLATVWMADGPPQWQAQRVFEPTWESGRRLAALARWRAAVAHARAWREDQHAA